MTIRQIVRKTTITMSRSLQRFPRCYSWNSDVLILREKAKVYEREGKGKTDEGRGGRGREATPFQIHISGYWTAPTFG